jgi:hypothetical protein
MRGNAASAPNTASEPAESSNCRRAGFSLKSAALDSIISLLKRVHLSYARAVPNVTSKARSRIRQRPAFPGCGSAFKLS